MTAMLKQTKWEVSWRRGPRGIFRDRASERLDWFLAREVRLIQSSLDAQQLLYLDLATGRYWELVFDDWADESGGQALLRRVSVDYVDREYPATPAITVVES